MPQRYIRFLSLLLRKTGHNLRLSGMEMWTVTGLRHLTECSSTKTERITMLQELSLMANLLPRTFLPITLTSAAKLNTSLPMRRIWTCLWLEWRRLKRKTPCVVSLSLGQGYSHTPAHHVYLLYWLSSATRHSHFPTLKSLSTNT